METEARLGWGRPLAGRKVAGVCRALSGRLGLPLGLLRAGFVLDALLGGFLLLLLSIFDVALFGAPLGTFVRTSGMALGLAGLLTYPALALVLPDSSSPRRWDFASATGAILLLMAVGQALGSLMEPYWRVAKDAWAQRGILGLLTWFEDYAETEGLGAKDLFGDEELTPIRGQLTVLLPQPEVDYIMGEGALSMIPRRDGIALGQTWEPGEWSLEPNPTETQRVMDGLTRFFADMA